MVCHVFGRNAQPHVRKALIGFVRWSVARRPRAASGGRGGGERHWEGGPSGLGGLCALQEGAGGGEGQGEPALRPGREGSFGHPDTFLRGRGRVLSRFTFFPGCGGAPSPITQVTPPPCWGAPFKCVFLNCSHTKPSIFSLMVSRSLKRNLKYV